MWCEIVEREEVGGEYQEGFVKCECRGFEGGLEGMEVLVDEGEGGTDESMMS